MTHCSFHSKILFVFFFSTEGKGGCKDRGWILRDGLMSQTGMHDVNSQRIQNFKRRLLYYMSYTEKERQISYCEKEQQLLSPEKQSLRFLYTTKLPFINEISTVKNTQNISINCCIFFRL